MVFLKMYTCVKVGAVRRYYKDGMPVLAETIPKDERVNIPCTAPVYMVPGPGKKKKYSCTREVKNKKEVKIEYYEDNKPVPRGKVPQQLRDINCADKELPPTIPRKPTRLKKPASPKRSPAKDMRSPKRSPPKRSPRRIPTKQKQKPLPPVPPKRKPHPPKKIEKTTNGYPLDM